MFLRVLTLLLFIQHRIHGDRDEREKGERTRREREERKRKNSDSMMAVYRGASSVSAAASLGTQVLTWKMQAIRLTRKRPGNSPRGFDEDSNLSIAIDFVIDWLRNDGI